MIKLVSKIIHINGKNTCIRLCNKEWAALDEICKKENIKRSKLVENIKDNKNSLLGLTGALRLFTILYYQNHSKAEITSKDIEHFLSIIK